TPRTAPPGSPPTPRPDPAGTRVRPPSRAPSAPPRRTVGGRWHDRGVIAEDAEAVLAGLDPEQREAATAVRGPVCILAGAGTGKTRAITHRIAYAVRSQALPPTQLLAVTFTARAASELRSR